MIKTWLVILGLIVFGVLLLLIELFTPTFGIIGVAGIILVGVACYLAATQQSIWAGIGVSVASAIIISLVIWWFFRSGLWRKLRLFHTQDREAGYHPEGKDLKGLLGKEGITATKLRPSGAAIIDGMRVDVVTDGVFVEEKARIKVTGVEGIKVRVKQLQGGV